MEAQFYGLLRLMMPTMVPYYAQEQIGVGLLRSACRAGINRAGTRPALKAALAQARQGGAGCTLIDPSFTAPGFSA